MKNNRVEAVLSNLEKMGLSQMLITDPLSIKYLTGKMIFPFERFYALYLSRKGNNKIFINILETVPEELGVEKIRFSDTDPYLDMAAEAIDHDEVLGVDKLLPARFLLPLMEKKAAKGFVNSSIAVDKARGVKDEQEKELMRRASKINDEALSILKTRVHAGVTETGLAGELKEIYSQLGAEGLSFEPLIAFGANAASGHHFPDNTELKSGDCVLIDCGCKVGGYCSDMTRTYFYQSVTPRQREVYNLVLRANVEAEKLVRAGLPLKAIDGIARKIITDGGFGEYFTHRLGHFIGMEDHDFGDVSSAAEDPAEVGNVFSIEPGIYLPGEFGVRIEDLVMVTEDGCENLNSLSKELEILP